MEVYGQESDPNFSATRIFITNDERVKFGEYLNSMASPTLIFIGVIGFIGSCLAYAIFARQKSESDRNDFLLYRLISVLDATGMLVLVLVRAWSLANCERDYACAFIWAHISIAVTNICSDVVDILVLFLCIERTMACLSPFGFKNFKMRPVELRVIFLTFLVAMTFGVLRSLEITLEYDVEEGIYRDAPSQLSTSRPFEILMAANMARFYFTASLMTAATVFSIVGLWRTARKSTVALNRRRTRRDRRRELDLCYLQLCTAVPIVINHLLFAMSTEPMAVAGYSQQYEARTYGNLSAKANATELMDNGSAEDFSNYKKHEYLKMMTNFSDALAHASPLYFYLIFSESVRRTFLSLCSQSSRRVNGSRGECRSENEQCGRMLEEYSYGSTLRSRRSEIT